MSLVSVVVPHYSDLKSLDRCLSALERQTLPRDNFEIVVADNASPEGEAAVAAVVADRARLTVVPLKGAGPARNGGVDAAIGEIIAFTDCDCLPEPRWLAEGLEALNRFDVVGGAMTVLVGDRENITPEEAFEVIFAFDNKTYVEAKGFSVSANLFCARSTFEAVGGFSVSKVSEDLEWCRRATARGFRLGYAPNAVVGHPARTTWTDLIKKWRRTNVEAFGVEAGRPGARLRWTLKTLALPLSAVAHTPKVLMFPADLTLADRLGALGVLYRLRLWRFANGFSLLAGDPR